MKFVNIEKTLSFYFTETLESQRLPTKFKDSVANSENGGNINRVQPTLKPGKYRQAFPFTPSKEVGTIRDVKKQGKDGGCLREYYTK